MQCVCFNNDKKNIPSVIVYWASYANHKIMDNRLEWERTSIRELKHKRKGYKSNNLEALGNESPYL